MTANRIESNSLDRTRGFTLIELLVTLIVLAILITIALPSYRSFIISNRLTGQINELVGDLSLTRNEAATRSQQVTMCIAASATACATSGSDWVAGRIIWVDINRNGSLDAATEILKYVPPLGDGVAMIASGPSNTSSITFLPYGMLSLASNWTFTLCSPGEPRGRQVDVPFSGRAIAKKIESCAL